MVYYWTIMQWPRQRSSPPSPPPFLNLGEAGNRFEGVCIRQAPFAEITIFGVKFEGVPIWWHYWNLVIWIPLGFSCTMPQTVCWNSVWFQFYGTLKFELCAELELGGVLLSLLSPLDNSVPPIFKNILIKLAQWNLVCTLLATIPRDIFRNFLKFPSQFWVLAFWKLLDF